MWTNTKPLWKYVRHSLCGCKHLTLNVFTKHKVEGADYVKFELSADLKMTESGGDLSEILASEKNEALETTGCVNFGQQGRIEYAITLDMAKELVMIEKTQTSPPLFHRLRKAGTR